MSKHTPEFTFAQAAVVETVLCRKTNRKLAELPDEELAEIESAVSLLRPGTTREYVTREAIVEKVLAERASRRKAEARP